MKESKASRKPSHPITNLPFVKKTRRGNIFWHVKPTGDYTKDCDTGTEYAIEAIKYSRLHPADFLPLQWVVFDMPRGDDRTGIEVGFLSTISHFIVRPWMTPKDFMKDRAQLKAWIAEEFSDEEAANE